jgi:hypothetical protein
MRHTGIFRKTFPNKKLKEIIDPRTVHLWKTLGKIFPSLSTFGNNVSWFGNLRKHGGKKFLGLSTFGNVSWFVHLWLGNNVF